MRNDNTIKITLRINKDTGELELVKKQLDQTGKKASQAGKQVEGFTSKLKKIALAVGGVYALKMAFSTLIDSGFSYNNTLEQQLSGLVALNVATSSNISAMGKQLSMTEKYNLANIEAHKTLKELEKINAATPHTLGQTAQIYKAMYVSMKKVGASSAEMVKITEKLSIAAGAAGIEFNSLLAGVDGLATGTVLANSDLGRFLGGLGLTNETLKESSDVVALLENKLSQFRAADTMSVAVSNLQNSWDQLSGTMTSVIFDDTKGAVKNLSFALADLNTGLNDYLDNVNYLHDIRELTQVADASRELQQLKDDYNALKESGVSWYQSEVSFNAELNKKAFLIKSLERHIKSLVKAQDSLKNEDSNPLLDFSKEIVANNEHYAKLEAKSIKDGAKAREKYQEELHEQKIKDDEAEGELQFMLFREKEQREAKAIDENQKKWKEAVKEFEAYDPDFDEVTKTANITFQRWGDTLNSSISGALTDAFLSQELYSAVQSLSASVSSSMTQASISNILSGKINQEEIRDAKGNITQAAGPGMASMGGVYGIAAGVGLSIISSQLDKAMNQGKSEAQKRAEALAKIKSELELQTSKLNAQIGFFTSAGRTGSALVTQEEKAYAQYTAGEKSARVETGWKFNNLYQGYREEYDFKDRDHVVNISHQISSLFSREVVEQGNAKYDAAMSVLDGTISEYASSLIDLSAEVAHAADGINSAYEILVGVDVLEGMQESAKMANAVRVLGEDFSQKDWISWSSKFLGSLAQYGVGVEDITSDIINGTREEQQTAVRLLGDLTNQYFTSNEEALNYIESLDYVGQTFVKQKEELDALLEISKKAEKDQYDAHLSWLNLLDKYNAQVDTTSTALSGISSALGGITSETDALNGMVSSFQSIINTTQKMIDEFRGGTSSSYGLREFQKAFSQAKTADDPKALSLAIEDMSRYSSSLTNLNNFNGNRYDMAFQQAVAANQLEAWQETAEVQKTDAELQLEVLERQESHLSSISRNTNSTAVSTNNLTKKDSVIGGLFTEVLSLGDEIQGIKTGEYTLLLGQDSSQALGDVFDGFFGSDGSMHQKISDWIDSNQTTLNLNNDEFLEAIKGVNVLGQKFIDLDIDGNGIMDIRMIQDASGNTLELQLLNQSLSAQQLDIRKLIQGDYSLSADEATRLQNLYNSSQTENQWLTAISSTTALSKLDTANLAGIYTDLGGVKTNTLDTKDGVNSLASDSLLAGIYSSTTNTYSSLSIMSMEISRIKSALYAQNQNWAGSGYYGYQDIGYQGGGYTGDIPTSRIAGSVHGQEYVVNARTTKDLGLNNGNGGVFKEILAELKTTKEENRRLHEKLYTVMNNTYNAQKQSLVLQKNRA